MKTNNVEHLSASAPRFNVGSGTEGPLVKAEGWAGRSPSAPTNERRKCSAKAKSRMAAGAKVRWARVDAAKVKGK